MKLNLYDILQEVLTESVDANSVINAIANKQQVIVKYSDDKDRAPGKRIIEPYTYGTTKAGNPCIRVYQYEGDTFRGKPKWKLLRLDRITSWQPTNRHFNTTPAANGWPAEGYNEEGDDSMSQVIYQVHFDGNETPDSLSAARAKTERLQNSTPIKVGDIEEPNQQGAITNNGYNPVKQKNPYTQETDTVVRGAIDLSKSDNNKDNNYWKDYDKANVEKNKQNKRFNKKQYDNTRNSLKNADKYKPNWHTNDNENNEIKENL